ncbi:hypothetical protein P170DRAFT_380002 [Aspergillus steynii IBT 23096]|uniref:Zn(2)-C6 fungal-type domain-containing protein n=1 Tax=Aspergillus steynii IBT 23096 TaxID=1392250 RepID=A0A2I2GKE9_9EURO|nr:uncharacterized protein P170DRAFT_380002 [Aspergillus steynii IBT 23096]PLB53356.1 hypothetical protein P170DRAFT_380002 [Aspergillus steynii IBT 23096]
MTPTVKRSHQGCARCKRRRQKCDERKPTCGRCSSAEVACEYKITLKWNGRVPREEKPSYHEESLVWRLDSHDSNNKLSKSEPVSHWTRGFNFFSLARSALHLQQPSSVLTSTSRLLLHHFITETSKISSSPHIRDQICQAILPMSHQSESLLYATMALSALHRCTMLNEPPTRFIPESLVADLIICSMRCLRRDLETPGYPVQPLLHTIRTLCHCEIFSGQANSFWRVHVNGAGAMFTEIVSRSDLDESENSFWLWSRWFRSIRALSAVTDIGNLSGTASRDLTTQDVDRSYFFDTYTGYSSDLNIVLMEIGSLLHLKGLSDVRIASVETRNTIEQKAEELKRSILYMIRRDTELGLKFPDQALITPETTFQFQACNTAYQYSGLIYLYRRVQGLPTSSNEVQGCVREILNAVSSILPVTTLSPWILLTTPIYTAGCEAMAQDRNLVKEILQDLYHALHIRNIMRALGLLEKRWEALDCSESLSLDPLERPKGNISDAADNSDWLDFIPY